MKEAVIVPAVDAMEGKEGLWQTKFELNAGKIPAKNIVHIRSGSNSTARNSVTPVECFQLIFISEDKATK